MSETQQAEAVASSSTNPPVTTAPAVPTTIPASDPSNPFESLTDEAFFHRTTKRDLLNLTQQLYAAYQAAAIPSAAAPISVTRGPTDREVAAEIARLEALRRTVPLPPSTLPQFPPYEDDDYEDWTRPRRTRSPSPPPGTTLALSIRDFKPPQPSTYSGARDYWKVTNWLAEVEQFCRFYNVNRHNGDAVNIAAMFMNGEAAVWWRMYKQTHPRRYPQSWVDFEALLILHFAPKNTEDTIREKLFMLTQKGSVLQYAAEFRRLLTLHPPMPMSDQLDRFKRGLKDRIRLELMVRRPRDLDEAEEIAMYLDSVYGKQQQGGLPNPPKPTPSPGAPNPPRPSNPGGRGQGSQFGQTGRGNGNAPRGQQPPAPQGNAGPRRLTDAEREYLRANNGCYRCRQLGHHTNQCPMYGNTNTNQAPVAQGNNQRPDRARQPARLNNAESQTLPPNDPGFVIRQQQ